MNKRKYKFNGGKGAVLCSKCSVIIREGKEILPEEREDMKGKLLENLKSIVCKNCEDALLTSCHKECH